MKFATVTIDGEEKKSDWFWKENRKELVWLDLFDVQ